MVKTLPAKAGHMGSIPDLGGSHMLRSSWACAPNCWVYLCSRAWELSLLKPMHHRKEETLLTTTAEKARTAMKTQHSRKSINRLFVKNTAIILYLSNVLYSPHLPRLLRANVIMDSGKQKNCGHWSIPHMNLYLLAFLIQKSQGQPWPLTQAGSDPRSLWQDSRSWRLYVSMTNSQHYTVHLSGRHFTTSFWRKSKDSKKRMEEGGKEAGGESKWGGEARRGHTSWAGGENPWTMAPTQQTALKVYKHYWQSERLWGAFLL